MTDSPRAGMDLRPRRRTAKNARLVCISFAVTALVGWAGMSARPEATGQSAVSITTFHGENSRLGWNARETRLTPANVVPATFGRRWHTALDDVVHGSPLLVADLEVKGKRQDVVFAATNGNSVYALSAADGSILWESKALAPPLTDSQFGWGRGKDPHGILSTPVIDLKTGTLYVCMPRARGLRQVFQSFALDIRTGKTRPGWPVTLDGEYRGARFTPGQLMQRGALALHEGWLYIPFGGRGDIPPWRGWVIGINTKNPKEKTRAFCASTSTDGAGIWSAGGVSIAPNGEFFVITGNGDYDFPQGNNLAQTVIRLRADSKGFGFSRQSKDFYTPENHLFLDEQDEDLGGASALVLPEQPGTSTPRLIFTGGKDGLAYLLNRDNLGGVGGEVQKFRYFCDPKATYHEGIRSTCAYFDAGAAGRFLYVPGDNPGPDNNLGMVALKLEPDTPGGPMRFHKVWTLPRQLGRPSSPIVTSDGTKNGLVWLVEPEYKDGGGVSVVRVYDALTGTETYNSETNSAQDRMEGGRNFTSITVANGRAYVGAQGVFCYGLKEGVGQ